jgi:hypothetical protein
MKYIRLLSGIVLMSIVILFIPQSVNAIGTTDVGFTLTTGQAKIIPVFVKKGEILKASINVLQQARVEFDLANLEMTFNVVKFGHIGAGDFYFVSPVDYQYNLIITNTGGSSSTMWGTVSYSVEPSTLPLGTTNGTPVAVYKDGKWEKPEVIVDPPLLPLPLWIFWVILSFIWVAATALTVYLVTKQYVNNYKAKTIIILGLASALSVVMLYIFFPKEFITAVYWITGIFIFIIVIILLSRVPKRQRTYEDEQDSTRDVNIRVHTRSVPCKTCGNTGRVPSLYIPGKRISCPDCDGTGWRYD